MFAHMIANQKAAALKARKGFDSVRSESAQRKHFRAYGVAVRQLLHLEKLVAGTPEEKLVAEALKVVGSRRCDITAS